VGITVTNLNTSVIIYNSFNSSSLPLSAGSYALQVTDQYGCVDLVNIQITEPAALIANTSTTTTTCFGGNDGSVTITGAGGTPAYSITGIPNSNSLSPGIYTYILTDANNCSVTQSFSILEPADIITTISSTNVSCLGGTDGTVTVNINGGTFPYYYIWSPSGFTSASVTSLDAGNHYVLITDANGCSPSAGQDLIVITEPSLNLAATFITTDVSCFGYSDGTALILPTGGTFPYTYNWSNGQTMQQASALVAGSYSCTVTDANGCTDLFTITINEPSEILANISVTDISCNGNIDGSALVSPSGGNGIYNVSWFNSTTNLFVTGLQIGSFHVTVTDNTGCTTGITMFNVVQPDTLILNAAIISEPSCFGGGDGSIDVTAIGGSLPYTYNWSNGQITSQAINLIAGTYSVIVVDANGCSGTTSISLTSPDTIVANISTSTTLCNGSSDGSATVIPSGGTAPYTYVWSGGLLSFNTDTYTGLNASTNYFVTITDSNLCTLSNIPVNVFEPDAISINFTLSDYNGFNVYCSNSSDGSVVVSANGGNAPYTYSADNLFFNTDTTFNNLSSGWFTAYVIDANDCPVIDSVELIAPEILDPNITIISNVTCSGSNDGIIASIIIGGAGTYSYLWSNLGVNDSIAGLSEGFYSVEVIDINGCVSSDTITLHPDFVLDGNISSTFISCTGFADGTAILVPDIGGTSPYTYLWDNGSTTQLIGNLPLGWYSCTMTDANGCEFTDSVQVLESPTSLSIYDIKITNVSCYGFNDGFAQVFAEGGIQLGGPFPYEFLWSGVMQTTSNVTDLYAGTFIVEVTDSAGCTVSDTIIINEPSQLTDTIEQTNISCFGFNDGIIVNTTLGGTLPYTINWQGPNNYNSNLDSIVDLAPGEYIITIEDSNMCRISDTVTITQQDAFTGSVSSSMPLCYNDANGIIEFLLAGGVNPYVATSESGVISYPNNNSIIITELSAGAIVLYVTDANGCVFGTDSFTVILTQPLELSIVVDESNPTCYGYFNGIAIANVSGGTPAYTYSLVDNSNIQITDQSQIFDLDAGNYTYIVTDFNGCVSSSEVNMISPNEIEISLLESCYGSLLVDVLNMNGNYQIFWDNALDSVYIDGLAPGLYNVTVIDDSLGCTRTDSFTINGLLDYTIYDASCQSLADGSIEVHNINGGYPPFSVIVNGELLAEDIVYSFSIDDLFASTNQITLVDAIGCELNETITVDYIGGYNCIEVPVVVSPNNDGINDSWHPIFDIDVDIEVIILNRWGEEEFYYSGNSLVFDWNCLATNGNNLPSTDYYYIIKYNDNNYSDMTGVITLIR